MAWAHFIDREQRHAAALDTSVNRVAAHADKSQASSFLDMLQKDFP